MSEVSNLLDNPNFKVWNDIITTIMNLPDEGMTETTLESMRGMMEGAMTPKMRQESVASTKRALEGENYTRAAALALLDNTKAEIANYVDSLDTTDLKRHFIMEMFSPLFEVLDEAVEQYHSFDIILPMTIEENANEPTYAHPSDAGADLAAAETVTLAPHSLGNKIKTGVHIALPEGWVAYVVPRSSIGLKTPLRLSNSIGVIDSSYRGDVSILYDNVSDSEYTINAGDRIAQLLVAPCYHFQAQVVEQLDVTDRNEGGFGSSGK